MASLDLPPPLTLARKHILQARDNAEAWYDFLRSQFGSSDLPTYVEGYNAIRIALDKALNDIATAEKER